MRKRYAWKLKNSFTKGKAQDLVLCSEQIRYVDSKIYPDTRSKIILGNTKLCTEVPGDRMQHCGLQKSRHIPLSGMNEDNRQLPSWSRSLKSHQYQQQFLKKIWARHWRSTGSVKHRKNCWKIWTRQRSSNFARILQNINVLTAILLRIGVISCSCGINLFELKYKRGPTTFQKGQLRFQFDPWLHH